MLLFQTLWFYHECEVRHAGIQKSLAAAFFAENVPLPPVSRDFGTFAVPNAAIDVT